MTALFISGSLGNKGGLSVTKSTSVAIISTCEMPHMSSGPATEKMISRCLLPSERHRKVLFLSFSFMGASLLLPWNKLPGMLKRF